MTAIELKQVEVVRVLKVMVDVAFNLCFDVFRLRSVCPVVFGRCKACKNKKEGKNGGYVRLKHIPRSGCRLEKNRCKGIVLFYSPKQFGEFEKGHFRQAGMTLQIAKNQFFIKRSSSTHKAMA